ncbi:sphingosine-1-phosphate phosphatase 2-like [Onthophagus taurus]|uniref:sphingosine-1-phosphate phosphatase 2-like n=1 Tax=Onthophagus taurus TaxID=166361 RepID=UPI000C201556|nr:sphingosine-1-phosphate phosphatase 1-like [Onthophagus taurus]
MEVIEYLKSSELVADIQQYFGIHLPHLEKKNENNFTNNKGKSKEDNPPYVITNKLWYYLFKLGTELGDELFYSLFIPFWFWNVDGFVGRRVIFVWAIVMWIGQAIKDIVKWPRPGFPSVKLQKKWALEYGMPSTHAMVGISIPFSVLLFTMNRYQYNVSIGLTLAILWCTLVCISRLYLGMHTVLDIIAGLLLAGIMMIPLVPIVNRLDNYFLTHPTGPLLCLVLSVLIIIYYPNSGKWTPTRGDTTMILSVSVGVQSGAWFNYQTGIMTAAELSPPYAIMWPSYTMLGCIILRTILGISVVLGLRAIAKDFFYNCLCAMLRLDADELKSTENTLENGRKNFVELGSKYLMCSSIGFCILYVIPLVFRYLNIERPTFYTEI